MVNQSDTTRLQAIRAQIAYLRNPDRKDGASRYEAEEAANSLEREADTLSEKLYWEGAERAKNNFNQQLT